MSKQGTLNIYFSRIYLTNKYNK